MIAFISFISKIYLYPMIIPFGIAGAFHDTVIVSAVGDKLAILTLPGMSSIVCTVSVTGCLPAPAPVFAIICKYISRSKLFVKLL